MIRLESIAGKLQKAEVIKISIYEFDEEREMKLIRADEREMGEQCILTLNKILLNNDRLDDLKRATDDTAYRETLCEEYGI